MNIRIFGLAALMAIFAGTTHKAHASDDATSATIDEMTDLGDVDMNSLDINTNDDDAVSPDARRRPPRWQPPRNRGRVVCYARNSTGRTFAAWGNWRTPLWRVQGAALQNCRRHSGFFRFSCRNVGCRRLR